MCCKHRSEASFAIMAYPVCHVYSCPSVRNSPWPWRHYWQSPTMADQVAAVCRSGYYMDQMRQIIHSVVYGHCRTKVPRQWSTLLSHADWTTVIRYWPRSVMVYTPASIQSVQNVVCYVMLCYVNTSRNCMRQLHLLPVHQRIRYKLTTLIVLCGWPTFVERLAQRSPQYRSFNHRRIAGGAWGAAAPPSWWRSRKFLGCRKFLGVDQKFS